MCVSAMEAQVLLLFDKLLQVLFAHEKHGVKCYLSLILCRTLYCCLRT